MSKHSEEKKARKLAQLLKNKRVQAINLQEGQLQRERDLEQEREEEVKAASRASSRNAKKPDNVVWSAKLQEIRNKNTGRKQMAQERWNRFAGTAEAGGRGL